MGPMAGENISEENINKYENSLKTVQNETEREKKRELNRKISRAP